MFIRDGRLLRFVSAGYSPKTHDGTYLEIEQKMFKRDIAVSAWPGVHLVCRGYTC